MMNSRWLSGLAMVWLSACSADSSLGSGSDREDRLSSSNGQRETPDAGAEQEAESDGESAGEADGADGEDEDTEVAPTGITPRPNEDSPGDEMPLPVTEDPSEDPSGVPPNPDPSEDPSGVPPNPDPSEDPSGDPPSPDPIDPDASPEEAAQAFCDTIAGYESKPYEEFDQSYWVSEEECDALDDQWEQADAVVNLEVAPLAGTWRDGTGDEAVELVLDATGHGTLRYGEPAELPPIEDPADAYLHDPNASSGVLTVYGLRLGFAYEVYPQAGRAGEMTFGVRTSEPWSEWCSLQEPKRGNMCYACEIGAGLGMVRAGSDCSEEVQGCYLTDTEPNTVLEVDCGRLQLCSSFEGPVCACNSEECRESTSTQQRTATLDPVDTDVLRVPNIWGSETRYLTRAE